MCAAQSPVNDPSRVSCLKAHIHAQGSSDWFEASDPIRLAGGEPHGGELLDNGENADEIPGAAGELPLLTDGVP